LTDPLAAQNQSFTLSSQIDEALNTPTSGTPPAPPSA
jgi:hypothetical protein